MKYFILLIMFLLLTACNEENQINAQDGLITKDIVTNLDTPWEILWGPDGYIWMTERYGRISRVNPNTGELTELITVDEVFEDGERGMLGMVLHPDFENNPYVYVSYTYHPGTTVVKTVRYTYNGSTLESPVTIIDNIKGAWNHDGSRLWIDDDLKLYMTTGDAAVAELAQDTSNLNGNLLRMNLDGSIPDDNPFPNSYIYSYGSRNAQGLVFANGKIYSSEHGPANDDEVNIFVAGGNYGWPNVMGYCDSPAEMDFCEEHNVIEPIAAWTPTLAVAGLDYYNHDFIPDFNNSLLLTTLKASRLVQLKLNAEGDEVINEQHLYTGEFGRLRDLCISPDGRLFIATSNRDGRGNPADVDDRIIEIIPESTDINNIDNGSIDISPAPSNGNININIRNPKYLGGSITIYNYEGKKLYHSGINSEYHNLTIPTSGVFFAFYQKDNFIFNKKIVVAK